jgi:hypothetical protein
MQWLPHRFEGPPNKENIYSPAIVPLRIKWVILRRPLG